MAGLGLEAIGGDAAFIGKEKGDDVNNFERRIGKLERDNRWYRNLFIFTWLIVVVLITWGATKPTPEVIRARRIEVVDKNGQVGAALGAWEGWGALTLFNKGKPGFNVSQSITGGGRVHVYGPTGKALIELSGSSGVARIIIKNSNGEDSIQIYGGIASGTGGIVRLYNKTREMAVHLYADEYGNGVVGAYNRKGQGRTLRPGS